MMDVIEKHADRYRRCLFCTDGRSGQNEKKQEVRHRKKAFRVSLFAGQQQLNYALMHYREIIRIMQCFDRMHFCAITENCSPYFYFLKHTV